MLTKAKLRANRNNSRKSTGPKTAGGKSIAARNARRHGLSVLTSQAAPPSRVAQFVKSACAGDDDPRLVQAATKVAQYSSMLEVIAQEQIMLIERLRHSSERALAAKDDSYTRALARAMQAWIAQHEIEEAVPGLMEKYKDQLPPELAFKGGLPEWFDKTGGILPIRLKALLTAPESLEEEREISKIVRDELGNCERADDEAFEAAIPDLVRIERYYQRAWVSYKRAVREFTYIKTALSRETQPSEPNPKCNALA
jgi:hypothetical protein